MSIDAVISWLGVGGLWWCCQWWEIGWSPGCHWDKWRCIAWDSMLNVTVRRLTEEPQHDYIEHGDVRGSMVDNWLERSFLAEGLRLHLHSQPIFVPNFMCQCSDLRMERIICGKWYSCKEQCLDIKAALYHEFAQWSATSLQSTLIFTKDPRNPGAFQVEKRPITCVTTADWRHGLYQVIGRRYDVWGRLV